METQGKADPKVIKVIASVILCVLLVFEVILAIGDPIVTLGSRWESFAYSIGIFLPVAAICLLAVSKSRKP